MTYSADAYRSGALQRARMTLAFCDAIWELHLDRNAFQDWEIESLCRLEEEAVIQIREQRAQLR